VFVAVFIMIMFMMIVGTIVIVRGIVMLMRFVSMMLRIGVVAGLVRGFLISVGLRNLRRIGTGALDDLALDAVAMTAAARVAVAWTPSVGAVFALFLGLAMGAFVGLYQCLTVSDRDLIIVRMDFAEGEEAVTVAAIFDEGGLQ
jgi:hypothetical protein